MLGVMPNVRPQGTSGDSNQGMGYDQGILWHELSSKRPFSFLVISFKDFFFVIHFFNCNNYVIHGQYLPPVTPWSIQSNLSMQGHSKFLVG